MRDYIICGTSSVVYIVECTSSRLHYVRYTMRPLRTRISKHYHSASYASEKGLSNVSKHIRHHQSGNMSLFTFYGLEKFKNPPQGGDTLQASRA